MEGRAQIRKRYRQLRDALTAEQVREWSRRINDHLTDHLLFLQAKTVLFYYPLGNEVNLLPAAEQALRLGKRVGFPRTEKETIRFYRVRDLREFEPGRFGVMEPVGRELLQEDERLLLTPGVVFDRRRNRMGYGKGYYDRYVGGQLGDAGKWTTDLRKRLGAKQIGVCYELQIARSVPAEKWDAPMDYLLTEKGIF